MMAESRMEQDPRDAKTLIAGFIDTQVVRRGLDWRTGEAYRIDLEHFYKWLEDVDQKTGQEPGKEQKMQAGLEPLQKQRSSCILPLDGHRWQEKMEAYLEYLTLEKRLRPSTVARKSRVFNYYLSYLVRQGLLPDCEPLKLRRAAGIPRRRGWEEAEGLTGAGRPDDAGCQRNRDGLSSADALAATGGPKGRGGRMDADVPRYANATAYVGAGQIKEDRAGGNGGDRMTKTDVDAFFLALEREYNGLDSDFRKRVCLRDLVMMELLFYHGIEVTELLRLEVADYDQKTGVLTVKKKRGRAEEIHLYSRALRERMERWISEHGEFEREAEYKERMFLSKLGRPLSMKMVINVFEKYRVLAGIEKEVTPKDLKGCMGEYARELMREWCG